MGLYIWNRWQPLHHQSVTVVGGPAGAATEAVPRDEVGNSEFCISHPSINPWPVRITGGSSGVVSGSGLAAFLSASALRRLSSGDISAAVIVTLISRCVPDETSCAVLVTIALPVTAVRWADCGVLCFCTTLLPDLRCALPGQCIPFRLISASRNKRSGQGQTGVTRMYFGKTATQIQTREIHSLRLPALPTIPVTCWMTGAWLLAAGDSS